MSKKIEEKEVQIDIDSMFNLDKAESLKITILGFELVIDSKQLTKYKEYKEEINNKWELMEEAVKAKDEGRINELSMVGKKPVPFVIALSPYGKAEAKKEKATRVREEKQSIDPALIEEAREVVKHETIRLQLSDLGAKVYPKVQRERLEKEIQTEISWWNGQGRTGKDGKPRPARNGEWELKVPYNEIP